MDSFFIDQERRSLIKDNSTSTVKVRDELRRKEQKHMRVRSQERKYRKDRQGTLAAYCTGSQQEDDEIFDRTKHVYQKQKYDDFNVKNNKHVYQKQKYDDFSVKNCLKGKAKGEQTHLMLSHSNSGSLDDCPCANCSLNLAPKLFLYCLTTIGLIVFIVLSSIAVYKLTPEMASRSRFNPAKFDDETKDFLSKHPSKRGKSKGERRHVDTDKDMTRLPNFDDEDEKFVADTAFNSELSEKHGRFQDSRESFSDRFPKWKNEARNDKMQNFIRKLMQTEEKIRSLKKSSKKRTSTVSDVLFDGDSDSLRYRRAVRRRPRYKHKKIRFDSVDEQSENHKEDLAENDRTKLGKHRKRDVIDDIGTEHRKVKVDKDKKYLDEVTKRRRDSDSHEMCADYYGADKNIKQHKEFKRNALEITDIGLLDKGSNTMFVRLPPKSDHSQIFKKCSHSPKAANTHEKYLTHPFYKENERYDKMLKITVGNVSTSNASNWPIVTFPHLNSDDSFEPLMDENKDYSVKHLNYDSQEISNYDDDKKVYRQNEDFVEHPKESHSRMLTDFRENRNNGVNNYIEDSEQMSEYSRITSPTVELNELKVDDESVENHDESKFDRQLYKRKFPFFHRTTKKKILETSSLITPTKTNATFIPVDKQPSTTRITTTTRRTTKNDDPEAKTELDFKTIDSNGYNGMLILTMLDTANITNKQCPLRKSSNDEKENTNNENILKLIEKQKGNLARELNAMEEWGKRIVETQGNASQVIFKPIMSLDRMKTLHNVNGKGPMPLFFDEIERLHISTVIPTNIDAEYQAKNNFGSDFYDMKLIKAQKDSYDINDGIPFDTGNIKDDTNEKLQKTIKYNKLMNFATTNSVMDMDLTTDYFTKYIELGSTIATSKPEIYQLDSVQNYLQGNNVEEESEQNEIDSNNMVYYKDAALQAYSDYGVLNERKPTSEVKENENSGLNKENRLSTSTSMYDHANNIPHATIPNADTFIKRDLREELDTNDIPSVFRSRGILSLESNSNYKNNMNLQKKAKNNLDVTYALENQTRSQDFSKKMVRNDFSESRGITTDEIYGNENKNINNRYIMPPNKKQQQNLYEPLDTQQNKRVENRDIYVSDGFNQRVLPTSTCMFNYYGQQTEASSTRFGNLNASYVNESTKDNLEKRNIFTDIKKKIYDKHHHKANDINEENVSVKVTQINHKDTKNRTATRQPEKKVKTVKVIPDGNKSKSQRSSSDYEDDEESQGFDFKTTEVYTPKLRKYGRKYSPRVSQVMPHEREKLSGLGGAIEGISATIQSNNQLLEGIKSENSNKSIASVWKGALRRVFACDTVLEPITPKLSIASITDPDIMAHVEQPFSAPILNIEKALKFKATSKVTSLPKAAIASTDYSATNKTINIQRVVINSRKVDEPGSHDGKKVHVKEKVVKRSPEEVMLFWGDLFYDEIDDNGESDNYSDNTMNKGNAYERSTNSIRYRSRRRSRHRNKRNAKKKAWNKITTLFQNTFSLNNSIDEPDEHVVEDKLGKICHKAAATLLVLDNAVEGRTQRDEPEGVTSNPLQLQHLLNLMGEWISYEVERRTCLDLPLDLKEYLIWLTVPNSPDTLLFENYANFDIEKKSFNEDKTDDVSNELADSDIFRSINTPLRNYIGVNDVSDNNFYNKIDGGNKLNDEVDDKDIFDKWKNEPSDDSSWETEEDRYRRVRSDRDFQKSLDNTYGMADSIDLELTTKASEREDDFRFDSRSDCLGTLRELEGLIREFDAMTEDEKNDVPGIREYLEDQMNLLHQYMASPGSEYGHKINLEEVDDNMERKKRNAKLASGENMELLRNDQLQDKHVEEERKMNETGSKKESKINYGDRTKLSNVPVTLEGVTEKDGYKKNNGQTQSMDGKVDKKKFRIIR